MIRVDRSTLSGLPAIRVVCDACGASGPLSWGNPESHWDLAIAVQQATSTGWVRRLDGHLLRDICPRCAAPAPPPVALFGRGIA